MARCGCMTRTRAFRSAGIPRTACNTTVFDWVHPYPAQVLFLEKVRLHDYCYETCGPANLQDLALVLLSAMLG